MKGNGRLRLLTFITGITLAFPAAALTWTSTASHQGGHGHGGARQAPQHRLLDARDAKVELWLPTLEKQPVQVDENGTARFKPSGIDYYHALVAKKGSETAVRYIAMRGRSSGESPGKLIGAAKADLEIVPDPYTREHQRYYEGRSAVFRVRFRGEPLTGQTVALETGNGSRLFINSDALGRVVIPLPQDFQQVEPGRRANPPSEFVVSTVKGGHRFSLTAQYHAAPSHWQSSQAGAWSGLAGFVAGLAVLGWTGSRRKGRAQA